MSAAATKSPITVDDLEQMPNGDGRYELIDGELVERPPVGAQAGWIAGEIIVLLSTYLRAERLGWVFGSDCGYQLFPNNPLKARYLDVSFVRLGRFPGEQIPEGFDRLDPDLAVEVISPKDLAYDVEKKLEEYLSAGVRLVRVVYPPTRTVRVVRSDRTGVSLRAEDELSGEDVVPGFRCHVADLFPPPPATPPAP
jgi:Uma2 family endonuclease